MASINKNGKIGWYATGLGAAMITVSFLLMLVGVQGAILHNFLQLGGLLTAILGYFLFDGRNYQIMVKAEKMANADDEDDDDEKADKDSR